jgi:hypothetical protein
VDPRAGLEFMKRRSVQPSHRINHTLLALQIIEIKYNSINPQATFSHTATEFSAKKEALVT